MTRVMRHLAALILLVAVFAAAGRSNAEIAPSTAQAWPDDAELEASGARIGQVTIRGLPIFDPNAPGEDKSLFRLADKWHIDTRDSVIEAQLLFRPGDLYLRRMLDETERNLRDLRFIREPEIQVVGYHDGLVDLEVITHDVWTTNPGISFGRSGGENSSGISLEELNFLGRGKQLQFDYNKDVDRSSYTVTWRDPAIWGSRWRSDVSLRDSDDGNGLLVAIERPFYSLDTRWSTGGLYAQDDTIEHVYRLGQQVAGFEQDKQLGEVQFGWSRGLLNGWTRRITAGLRHEEASFGLAPDEPVPAALPENRDLAYPFMRFEGVQDDFETARNLDQIARTEDRQFGVRYSFELGWSDPAFGSDRSAALLRAEASRGLRLGDDQSLFLFSSLSGRVETGSVADSLLAGGVRYYRETGRRTLFFAGIGAEVGHNLDADHELSIGGDSGLRGYPLRFQTGSGRALLTLEERYYTNRSLWKIADIGGAVFFDAGRTWGESAFGPTENLGWLKDIGIGLRLGNSRSALGNVLHIDLAFPLDGPSSLDNVQLLIQTKRSF
jgi:surface antigen Omp85-like protein